MVIPDLVHRTGPKAAFEMLTLGENISAQQAESHGLINRVVPNDRVLDEAVGEALAEFDSRTIRATKRVFLKSTQLPPAEALDSAGETMVQLRALME